MNLDQLRAKREDYYQVWLDCVRAGSLVRQDYWQKLIDDLDRRIAAKEEA